MAALPCEVLPCVCAALDAKAALAVGAAAHAWRLAAAGNSEATNEAWRRRFIHFWRVRQKPGFMRAWWHKLLASGAAEPAALALTATLPKGEAIDLEEELPFQPPSPAEASSLAAPPTAGPTSLWHQRFVRATADLRRAHLTEAELCFDVALDRRAAAEPRPRSRGDAEAQSADQVVGPPVAPAPAFARRWVLAAGALRADFLGDELHFRTDGSVEARSCLFGLLPSPTADWQWRLAGGGCQVVLSCQPERQWGEEEVVVVLVVERASDGGFILRGNQGLILCSREKTEEEHIYRNYSILRFPPSLRIVMEELADGRRHTPHAFPPALTSFERLAVHRLAEGLALRHDSRGVGVHRRIVVWRPGEAVPPEHALPPDGGAIGQGAAAALEVAAAAAAARTAIGTEVAA